MNTLNYNSNFLIEFLWVLRHVLIENIIKIKYSDRNQFAHLISFSVNSTINYVLEESNHIVYESYKICIN